MKTVSAVVICATLTACTSITVNTQGDVNVTSTQTINRRIDVADQPAQPAVTIEERRAR